MKKSLSVVILILLLVSMTIVLQTVRAEYNNPKTIVVPDDFSSIQVAIDSAIDGDTIFVKKGVYTENITVDKLITLIGQDRDATILNATTGLRVTRTNVTIAGFTIGYNGCGNLILERNYINFTNNKLSALELYESNNCYIDRNIFKFGGSAIRLSNSHNNMIAGNYILAREGLRIWSSSSNNTFTENTLNNCSEVAIRLYGVANNNMITQNNITNSDIGLIIYLSNGNIIADNNFVDNIVQFSSNESYAQTFGYNVSVNNINHNYWSDYNGTDANGDGIGDTPHFLYENNQDNNPIMSPFTITNALPNPTPTPTISPSLSTSPSLSPLSTPSASPTQQPTPSPSPTATVPEFPAWMVLPLFVAGVVLVVVVYRRR